MRADTTLRRALGGVAVFLVLASGASAADVAPIAEVTWS